MKIPKREHYTNFGEYVSDYAALARAVRENPAQPSYAVVEGNIARKEGAYRSEQARKAGEWEQGVVNQYNRKVPLAEALTGGVKSIGAERKTNPEAMAKKAEAMERLQQEAHLKASIRLAKR